MPRYASPKTMVDELVRNFTREFSEVLTNAVAGAADDALERIEDKGRSVLERIGRARTVAQKRSKRGRRIRP
jgi:hypothetical protein